MMAATSRWTVMGRDAAEALAESSGKPVVFVADAVNGFARHLRAGETQSQAVRDFEAAGEEAIRSEVFGG